MKVVIAPDSFKESLPAKQVAEAIKRGFEKAIPNVECLLLPVGDEVLMSYFQKGDLALFEVADLIGLAKIPFEKRNPLEIQTKGIGQLILHLIDQGIKDIYVGVGGTASNDGGIGIASGLGYQFYDKNGIVLQANGQTLFDFIKISKEGVLQIPSDVHIKILADVTNPLCGPHGATFTFGKQKGLDLSKFQKVDAAIKNFYSKVAPEILKLDGAGAGLCAFAGAEIVSGIQTCLDLINFDQKVTDADLVIVGEGRLDSQSLAGKAPIGVAKRTPSGVPVLAICGSLSEDLPPLPFENIIAAFSILEKNEPLADSFKKAAVYLENTAASIARIMSLR